MTDIAKLATTLVVDSLILSENRIEQAREFIKLLTGDSETRCTFSCFVDKKSLKLQPKNLFGSISEHYEKLEALNAQGYGIFITIQETFSTARKAENIGNTRALFADLDIEGLPEKYHLEPSFIVESSAGKHHLYWLLEKPTKLSADDFKSAISPIIGYYKADEACKDIVRVLRLPGFYHCKEEPFLTRVVSISSNRYDLSQITIDKPVKTEVKVKSKVELKPEQLPEISTLDPAYSIRLHDECAKVLAHITHLKRGKRHNTLNKKAYYLGGILSAYPDLLEEYRQKLHDLVTSLENSGKWDVQEATHTTIDSAIQAGTKKPIVLEAEEKISKSNMLKRQIRAWLADFGDLEWNQMKLRVEIDRQEVEINYLRQKFQEDFNTDCGKEAFTDIITYLSKENGYHPVREYLNNSLPACDDPEKVMNTLFQIMGIDKNPEIQSIQVKKWLIAAVARIFDPGCQVDNVLILKSPKQGIGKTSFFQALFDEFFQTAGSHKSEADEILALKQAWASEYGEIDCVFDKKGIESLKAFLTKRFDTFRAPYAAASATLQRDFIFCGTTNQEQFLADKTGNRRYWVVDIPGRIDIKAIESLRDEIWSAAKTLYFAGIQGTKANDKPDYVDFLWWFDEREDELAKENIANSEQEDTWEDDIMNYMKLTRYASISQIKKELGYPDNRMSDMRISAILKQNGLKTPKNPTIHNGIKARYWSYSDCENIEKELEQIKTKKEEPKAETELKDALLANRDDEKSLALLIAENSLDDLYKACVGIGGEDGTNWFLYCKNVKNNQEREDKLTQSLKAVNAVVLNVNDNLPENYEF